MIDFGGPSVFGTAPTIKIPETAQVVFVSDMFSSDHLGGAELTTDALIDASPFQVFRLHSKDVTLELLKEGHSKFWIFGNFSGMDAQLIPSIIGNMKYSVVEYDYKFCKYRSPEKHEAVESVPCNCSQDIHGKLISAFMLGARSLWWMSEQQMQTYHKHFPFLEKSRNTVLSSVFDDEFFATAKLLREANPVEDRKGWVIVGSTSWIKGVPEAEMFCQSNDLDYEVLWKLPYKQLLERMAKAEGLVFLPKGGDTCPRIVIEAKLLGCKLHINDNVQHAKEIWFDTDDLFDTESYLYMARDRFWNGIKSDMVFVPEISGYTTTRNCVEQDYPFQESIRSMLGFCDEVVVVDGGSTDGTWEILEDWASKEEKLVIHQEVRDWNHPRFAVFDGAQKAVARSLCTKPLCWQQDSDEVVHEDDYIKIQRIAKDLPGAVQLLSLPVIEYWGGPTKVRMDIFPWKWRLSRNHPHITHGIPASLRQFDEDGNLYALPGTDGCDYVNSVSFEPIPHSTFYTADVDTVRRNGLQSPEHRERYEGWFNMMLDNFPSVHHYSWFNISRKIRTYRDYWSQHWQSLYNIEQEDTAENNMFFGRPWSDVTEDDIERMSDRLAMEMGGWIFHTPVNFAAATPSLAPHQTHPGVMVPWLLTHRQIIDDDSLKSIDALIKNLQEVKGDDNWDSVRSAGDNYELIEREYPFGTRQCYTLPQDHTTYENLQQSRGIQLELGDDVETYVSRAINSMEDLTDPDRLRMSQILSTMNEFPKGFAELGFRVPRLQRYFISRGIERAVGYDVAEVSLRFGDALGYDVRHFDFSTLEGELDLSGCDLVVSYHMLEHLSDPLPAVKHIFDSMDEGATFHVEIPIEPGVPRLNFAHMFPFHQGDMGEMLKIAGFDIVDFNNQRYRGGPEVERYVAVKRSK